jgi:hypothetical protein
MTTIDPRFQRAVADFKASLADEQKKEATAEAELSSARRYSAGQRVEGASRSSVHCLLRSVFPKHATEGSDIHDSGKKDQS